jgi:hypothetical protein
VNAKASGFLALVLFVALLHAQNPSGTLRGMVQDSTGARVASATIAVRLQSSSLARSVSSDDHGDFRIDDLTPGTYDVSVAARGFTEATADVPIAVSAIRDITVTMKPLVVRETIGVEAKTSSITTQPSPC